MHPIELRPTFQITLTDCRGEAMEKVRVLHKKNGPAHGLLMFGEYGELHLPDDELRFWSPHLSFYFSQEADRCLIRGRFAPRLDLWTLIWIAYLFMAFSAFFGLILAVCQWSLGGSPWGLWVSLAGLACIGLIYWIANTGQRLSSDQMRQLRDRLNLVLDESGITYER
jgi:hypothetical protein